jgi:hypothetical protein
MADAPKETNAEKIARLREEIELKKLEAEQAKLTKTPPVKAAKEAVKEGASKVGSGLAKGGKATGSFIAKQAGFGAKVPNPVTGRLETPPSFLEKGLQTLSDVAGWFGKKAAEKVAMANAKTASEKVVLGMTEQQRIQKGVEDAKRARAVQEAIADQAKTQRLNTPSPNLDVGPDKKVVVSKRGVQAVVPKDTPDITVRDPLDARVNRFKLKLEGYVNENSAVVRSGNKPTIKQVALDAAKLKASGGAAGGILAEDFILKGLNRSGLFTADEVPLVAKSILEDKGLRTKLTDSQLFSGIDRPPTRVSGGAPVPITFRDGRVVPVYSGAPPEGKAPSLRNVTNVETGVETLAEQRVGRTGLKPEFPVKSGEKPNTDVAVVLAKRKADREAASLAEIESERVERARVQALKDEIKLKLEKGGASPVADLSQSPTSLARAAERARIEALYQSGGLSPEQEIEYKRMLAIEEARAKAAGGATKPVDPYAEGREFDRRLARFKNQPQPLNTATSGKPVNLASPAQAELAAKEAAAARRGGILGNTQWVRGAGRLGLQALGVTPDFMTGVMFGKQGSAISSEGRVLLPSEMVEVSGMNMPKESLDIMTRMHPDNAANHPEIRHKDRFKFNPAWYNNDPYEAFKLDYSNDIAGPKPSWATGVEAPQGFTDMINSQR